MYFLPWSGAVPELHGLTACFSLGVRRARIYSPNPPILSVQDQSLCFLPNAPPPTQFIGLVWWTVPDILTPIDRLWMWRHHEQSTTWHRGAPFSGGSKDRVSIGSVFTPRIHEQLTHAVWAQKLGFFTDTIFTTNKVVLFHISYFGRTLSCLSNISKYT